MSDSEVGIASLWGVVSSRDLINGLRRLFYSEGILLAQTITGLRLQSRAKNRVNVYLDGGFGFGLSKVLAAELKVGQQLDEDQIKKIQSRDAEEVAYQRALNLISRRPRSEQELRMCFRRKRISEEAQDGAIARLIECGLIDDYAFAETWIENRMSFRPRSAYALRYELRRKGIAIEVIEASLEGFSDEQAAYLAAIKAARRYRGLSEKQFRERLSGYLSRRGFVYSIISAVTDRIWGEVTASENGK